MAKKKMGGLGKGLDSLFADLSDDTGSERAHCEIECGESGDQRVSDAGPRTQADVALQRHAAEEDRDADRGGGRGGGGAHRLSP